MAILEYDNEVPYDTPEYTYDGRRLAGHIIAVRGSIVDRCHLAGVLDDTDSVIGILTDRQPIAGDIADRSVLRGSLDDSGGMMGEL